MPPFQPLFRNPHLQTIAGHFWPRPHVAARDRLLRTEPDVQVRVQSSGEPGRPAVVMVHGLEGSGAAGYMRSLANAALAHGFSAHRFHMRTCGGTEHLCQTLYHAGLTSDLHSVLRQLRAEGYTPAFVVGFSLGANVVLKLAGELGEAARELLGGVCGVSAPVDLAICARRIAEPDNYFYQRRFVRRMIARLRAAGRQCARYRTVVEIDDAITAPSFGFRDAQHYYSTQSCMRFLDEIRVPALLIQAKDDTFIPFATFECDAVRCNPWIELMATEHGAHLGFVGRKPHRFWVDDAVMTWIGVHARQQTALPHFAHHE